MASPRKDKRFSHMSKDPRFNNMKKEDRKVKIDRRFNSMFEDKRFKLKYMVDKRGRPIQTTSNEDLRKYYELSSSDGEDIVQNEKTARKKKKVGANNNKISEDYTRRLSVGKEKTKTQKKKKMIAIEEFQRKSALRSHEKKGNSVLSEEYGMVLFLFIVLVAVHFCSKLFTACSNCHSRSILLSMGKNIRA